MCRIHPKDLEVSATPVGNPSLYAMLSERSDFMIELNKSIDEIERKRLQIHEFILVLSIAFLPGLIKSTYVAIFGEQIYNYSFQTMDIIYSISNVEKILALLLVMYVYSRQRKRIRDLGLSLRFKDFTWAIALFIIAIVVFYLYDLILYSFTSKLYLPTNVDFLNSKVTIWFLLFLIINPFFEEIIVRGFVICQLNELTKSSAISVLASTLIQTSYHFYQGIQITVSYAIVFLIFSLFYVKTKRLTPVVISHLMLDLLILVR